MAFLGQSFQILQHEQDRHTHTDTTERITTPHSPVVNNNNNHVFSMTSPSKIGKDGVLILTRKKQKTEKAETNIFCLMFIKTRLKNGMAEN